MVDNLCRAIAGVLLPPLLVALEKGIKIEFVISLVLTILLLWVGGIIYSFYVIGLKDLAKNILSALLPPVAVYLHKGLTTEFWISLILTIFFWVPGMIYSYYLVLGSSYHLMDN